MSPEASALAASRIAADEWGKWQGFYDDRARKCPFFLLSPDENLREWLDAGMLAPGRALDVGCGNARNSIFLARNGFSVDAVDVSASALRWARDEVANAGAGVRLHHASIFDIDLAPGSYDLAYDGGCFHHMAPLQREPYIRRVADALKPGGAFGMVCFTPEGGSGFTDAEVYERQSLGGGLGYDEAQLRAMWGGRFDIRVLRRMREQAPGAGVFGRDFLWVMLATKR